MAEPTSQAHRGGHRWGRGELVLATALFFSGVAALVNQSVWQRSLNIYLAGCEAISAMVVVLVFMLGLGLGSFYVGLRSRRLRDPLLWLAVVELLLLGLNLGLAALLRRDISESVYASQRLAVSLGLPLRVVYAVSAMVVLLGPCFLMGMTFPLASDGCQRQLGESNRRQLPLFVFANTAGAVLGAAASGFVLMPFVGQTWSLVAGAACNGVAGLVTLALRAGAKRTEAAGSEPSIGAAAASPAPTDQGNGHAPRGADGTRSVPTTGAGRRELAVAFFLGLLALAYEMFIFRLISLAHEPRPYNFSLILCYYLLLWSVGAALAKRVHGGSVIVLALCGLSVAIVPAFHDLDRWVLKDEYGRAIVIASAAVYCLPCLFFGLAFGQFLSRAARQWGRDVGRFYGYNTIGSCLGILLMTLVGLEFDHQHTAWAIGLGYVGLLLYCRPGLSVEGSWLARPAVAAGIAGATAVVGVWLFVRHQESPRYETQPQLAAYYGKDGVVEIATNGDMSWSGLWHSRLSDGENHVGTANWRLAVAPLICHPDEVLEDTLVIGLGTGITAASLAASPAVRHVDVYEINHTLKPVLRDHPDGTLRVAENPKVRILWQDGRSGLALRDQRYDLITQQPLYLKQAGSGMLLSREYMQLVRSRLKPRGIFCCYCNAMGDQTMAAIVRRTVAEVFPHCESFYGGYAIMASDEPIRLSAAAVERRISQGGPLAAEMSRTPTESFLGGLDAPRLDWTSPHRVTDDHPIVEFYDVRSLWTKARRLVKRKADLLSASPAAARSTKPHRMMIERCRRTGVSALRQFCFSRIARRSKVLSTRDSADSAF